MILFLLGVIAGLVLSEFLPADIVQKIGKIKLKNSNDNQILDNIPDTSNDGSDPPPQRIKFFKRIFKKKNRTP